MTFYQSIQTFSLQFQGKIQNSEKQMQIVRYKIKAAIFFFNYYSNGVKKKFEFHLI